MCPQRLPIGSNSICEYTRMTTASRMVILSPRFWSCPAIAKHFRATSAGVSSPMERMVAAHELSPLGRPLGFPVCPGFHALRGVLCCPCFLVCFARDGIQAASSLTRLCFAARALAARRFSVSENPHVGIERTSMIFRALRSPIKGKMRSRVSLSLIP